MTYESEIDGSDMRQTTHLQSTREGGLKLVMGYSVNAVALGRALSDYFFFLVGVAALLAEGATAFLGEAATAFLPLLLR